MMDLQGGMILRALRRLRGGVRRGSFALAVFCAAAFLPSFASLAGTYTWSGGASGTLTDAAKWTPALQGTFSADDELVIKDAAEITLNAAATVGKITVNATGAVRFLAPGGAPFTIGSVENAGAGTVTFDCATHFSGTYYVTQNGKVSFPGGATATYPDNALRTASSTDRTRTLDGDFTFTEDWIVNNAGDYPWIVPDGSTVHGKVFSGTEASGNRILRVEEGGSAYFTAITNGLNCGDIDIDGWLESSGDMIVNTQTASSSAVHNFGRAGNVGTVKARRIAKLGHATASSLIPNLIVGAGGFGTLTQDYSYRLDVDTTITASDNFEFLGVYRSANAADWCIALNSHQLTVNVPAGLTVTCGVGLNTAASTVRKTGAGTLVMKDGYNGQTGFAKVYANGTFIDEGTVRLESTGHLGTGPVSVASGATLQVAGGVTVSNQVDGDGTLYLEDGVTLAIGSRPWYVGSVALASGANVTLTSGVSSGSYALLTGVDAADLAHFTLDGATLSVVGDSLLTSAGTAGAYVWNGASGADWSAAGNWLVDGVAPATAPASTDTIVFQNAAPVTVGGAGTLTVTKIVTLSDDLVTFSCPVQFAGTYLVENAATAPLFAGGATATYADASLTDMNIPSHTLNGAITFTADWTIPLQPTPFIVAENSTLRGTVLASSEYAAAQPDIRIDAGAVATFDTIKVGGLLLFWLNGGNLVATGDVHLGGVATNRNVGYSVNPNIGTLEAHGIFKNVTSYGKINCYVTNMVVGAGGFGMYRKDYSIQLYKDLTLTAKDDLTIYQPISGDGPKDGDWGLNLSTFTFTLNTAGHTVTFDSYVSSSAAMIVKEGLGEMIMQSRQKQHTGGTVVREGQMTVKLSGAQGSGPVTVESGATLANTVVVAGSSTLTLAAGAILKPEQNAYFDYTGGTVALPATGTVTVDMTDFMFVNGVANPILGGVAAGDVAKFTALVPAGVSGAFSVSGGFLYYTATAGGSAAADLFWHPAGDPTWSAAVAAWTNAAGEQVAFSPYANVTVADAATITLSENVDANDVTVSADGDVTLNGAGKIGGPGAIVKTGAGTFTFNATGGLDAQPVIVSNGVFKMGADLAGPLGGTADSAPIVVASGATLDVNFSNATPSDAERSKVTREKLVCVAGDGADGRGAIVNDAYATYYTFSDMVLEDDATMGGTKRFDVRGGMSGYARNGGSITGPGKTLTVLNPAFFGIVNASVDLKEIVVTNGGALRVEGSTANWNVSDGITLRGGKLSTYGNTLGANVAVTAESGANTIESGTGTTAINGPITVAEGATLTQTSGNVVYGGSVDGTLKLSGGYAYLDGCVPANGFTLTGAMGTERMYLRESGTFSGANVLCAICGVADASNMTVNATFVDSTLDIKELYLGWGNAFVKGGNLTLGEGTTLTTGKIAIGDSATNVYDGVGSSLTVDGGMLHHTNLYFYVGYNGPHAEFILNSGTVTVDNASIQLHANTAVAFAHLGGHSSSIFRQNGGTFNYGGTGFTSNEFEDNTEDGSIVFKGGTFNASASWSIPFYIPLCFKNGAEEGGWTLNQADGTTATWTTALYGDGDVTLNGAATLVGNKEVQGAAGGKWTVGDGFTAGLEGAASLLGGLDLGEGATATVNIATNRSAVFTARDGGDEFGNAGCITSRFNKAVGGTTRGTITHDENFLVTKYVAADRPFGNRNYSAAYATGQFYVEPEKAGKWYFKGYCDDYILLEIDGETVLTSVGGAKCVTQYGTNELAAGWHTFRHVATDVGGTFGNAPTMAYNTDGSSTYTPFSVKTLKMRPAADRGSPDNANTIRWSHYKGTAATVGNADQANAGGTLWKNDFEWDFRCITNNLQMLDWKGNNQPDYLTGYTINRFEGWFLVTEENADKAWTFRAQYDDNLALWIDGVDARLTGRPSGNTESYVVTLAHGWHSFKIQIADYAGNAGPWSTAKPTLSYQVSGGAETQFSEETLQLSVCPDGYVQGGVTLASGATLTNTAGGTGSVPSTAAVIYGGVTATGTGATMSGPFKFEGGKLAFQNVAPNTHDLADVLAFENPAQDFLANVGEITVDFTDTPTRGKIAICPLGGMTQAAVEAKLAVTVNGEPFDKFQLQIANGIVYLNKGGTVIMVR